MSLIDSISKQKSTNSQKWRTLVAVIFFLCGVCAVLLGSHHLSSVIEVPNCINFVDEQLEENIVQTRNENEVDQIVNSFGKIQVEIQGAVKNPGAYWLKSDTRLGELIEVAGGLTENADQEYFKKHLNMSQKLSDEQKITIPTKESKELAELLRDYCVNLKQIEENVKIENDAQDNQSETEEAGIETSSNQNCISINYASSTDLQKLTGVGEKTAELIIESRPYSKVSELLNVKGIGEATLEKIEKEICL